MHNSSARPRPLPPPESGGSSGNTRGAITIHSAPIVYGTYEENVEYLALLRRHRYAVLGIFALCLAAGLLYAKFAPRSYRAQTVLEITGVNQDFMNSRDVNPNGGGMEPDSYLETQIRLLQNEAVIDGVEKTVAPMVPASIASTEAAREAFVGKILAKAKVKEEGASNLVSITLSGPNPDLVAKTANALTTVFIREGENARIAAAYSTSKFLQQELADAQNKLQASEDALQQYANASGIVITPADQDSVATQHLREIQQGLAQAQVDLANRRSQMEMISNSPVDALPAVTDDPTIREDRARLTDLNRQLADLSTTMTPNNYKVRQVQAQIHDIENQMRQHQAVIVSSMKVQDQETARRVQLLRDAYQKQLGVVFDQGSKQVRFNMLKHEVDVNQQIYQSMLEKVKQAGIIAGLRASNARVVSAAEVPDTPYSPKLFVCMLLAGLAALALSVLYVLIAERHDNSVRAPGQAEQYIARPELAVIPRARLRAKPSRGSLGLKMNDGIGPASLHPMLQHWRSPDRTFLAEAYRSASTSILFSRSDAGAPHVLLVTSPQPESGKTTTSANLGISLAEGGRRVLIIDGDLRRPALPQLFGIKNKEGLSNLLDGVETLDDSHFVLPTSFSGVHVLCAGGIRGSVGRLLHSDRLPALVERFRRRYDFVLIDAPPLLGLADARILARCADGVILVCRAGQTSVDDLDEARKLLAEDGTHILGTILNGYDLQREKSSHYSSYLRYIG
jgi:polysaccharide biosynthesis transport protein